MAEKKVYYRPQVQITTLERVAWKLVKKEDTLVKGAELLLGRKIDMTANEGVAFALKAKGFTRDDIYQYLLSVRRIEKAPKL